MQPHWTWLPSANRVAGREPLDNRSNPRNSAAYRRQIKIQEGRSSARKIVVLVEGIGLFGFAQALQMCAGRVAEDSIASYRCRKPITAILVLAQFQNALKGHEFTRAVYPAGKMRL
jgi:hypothetical protein